MRLKISEGFDLGHEQNHQTHILIKSLFKLNIIAHVNPHIFNLPSQTPIQDF